MLATFKYILLSGFSFLFASFVFSFRPKRKEKEGESLNDYSPGRGEFAVLQFILLTGAIVSNYTFAMINTFCRRAAALMLAMIGIITSGCAKKTEADTTFIILTAPTVEPVVTPAPTPEITPAPKRTPKATKAPEDNKKEDEVKDKPKSTADQKEEKKASGKTPHAKDYTEVDIKTGSGSKVGPFETDRIDGGKLSQSYFSGGTITLVNVWSTT